MIKLLLTALFLTASCFAITRLTNPAVPEVIDGTAIVERLREAAELSTLRIESVQLVESSLKGWLGSARCLLVAHTTTSHRRLAVPSW